MIFLIFFDFFDFFQTPTKFPFFFKKKGWYLSNIFRIHGFGIALLVLLFVVFARVNLFSLFYFAFFLYGNKAGKWPFLRKFVFFFSFFFLFFFFFFSFFFLFFFFFFLFFSFSFSFSLSFSYHPSFQMLMDVVFCFNLCYSPILFVIRNSS